MKMKILFAALLLGGAAHAQTTPPPVSPAPTASPATAPPATTTSPAEQIPTPVIGTIDSSPLPSTQQPRQERVRKRQTVMDGQPSPGVETTDDRRAPRSKAKKPRPARTPAATNPSR